MKDTYIETFKSLDKSKLMTKAQVFEHLIENGEHEPSLAEISSRYESEIGIDPIWRYPLSDDVHNGAFIVPVQEGFLWIPYDEVDPEYYEILLLKEASMLDAECCARFRKVLREYTDSLCAVFGAIIGDFCESIPHEIATVQYYSVWDGGIEIGSIAKLDVRTGEVSDIGESDVDADVDGIDNLDYEYIVWNGKKIKVYQAVSGFVFWADLYGTY